MSDKQKLEKTADALHARLVKIYHAEGDFFDHVRCAGCSKIYPFEEIECGHWIKRRHRATRWKTKNALPLCTVCNQQDVDITDQLRDIWGQHVLDDLLKWKNGGVKADATYVQEEVERLRKDLEIFEELYL